MKKAVETTAVVNKLFPENVRDRILQANTTDESNVNGRRGDFAADKPRAKNEEQPIAGKFDLCSK